MRYYFNQGESDRLRTLSKAARTRIRQNEGKVVNRHYLRTKYEREYFEFMETMIDALK